MDLEEINLQDAQGDVDLLLIGNTSSGKSSTGNRIIGHTVFRAAGGWVSVTRRHHVGVTNINGRAVKVVDTPGFNDTELRTRRERLNLVIDELTRALIQFPNGFHAVVLVVPYTRRIDENERSTINTMVSLLGHESFERHGILALSHGDAFRRDFPAMNGDVANWMERLPSKYQWINDLCGERCVLFDNITEDVHIQSRQRQNLINLVTPLGRSQRYVPSICNVPNDSRLSVLRDRENVIKFIKASRILGILRFKVQMAVMSDRIFTHETTQGLRDDGRAVVETLTNDRVFSASTLETLTRKLNDLNYRDEYVQNAANEILEAVHSLQMKIDAKLESTLYWQSLRQRVADFFNWMFSSCVII